MPRQMSIILPPTEVRELISTAGGITGVTSIIHFPEAAKSPAGDVVELTMTHRALMQVMHLLDERGIGKRHDTSITMYENTAEISPSSWNLLGSDPYESTFEEMETISGKESNSTRGTMMLMALSGFITAYGISTNALHIALGAMLIAPGFVPLTRVALGIITGRSSLLRGLRDSCMLYSVLLLGALAAALLIKAGGNNPLHMSTAYLEPGVLIQQWSSITTPALLVSTAASIGGALLIGSNRMTLTAGVMLILGLIAPAVLSVLAFTAGNVELALDALAKWLLEVLLVTAMATAVFTWKRLSFHKRKQMH